jgi:predicted adenylyl cyclase CyaB
MKEVEILVKVLEDKEKALAILNKFTPKGAKEVLDIYYYDPLRKELQITNGKSPIQWFRIRKKGEKSYITFKEDVFNKKNIWIHSEELETEIKDFKITEQIIKNLGFKELVTIKNKKHIFETKDYEIILEEAENLGLFLEVERLNVKNDENPEEIKKEIQEFIKNLRIKTEPESNLGKPEMMLKKLKKY